MNIMYFIIELSKWAIDYKYRKNLGSRTEGDAPLYDKNIAIMATKRERHKSF